MATRENGDTLSYAAFEVRLIDTYRTYRVQRAEKEALLLFMIDALEQQGCRIIHRSPSNFAPFRITYETPTGERQGIVAYAFFANDEKIKNRPPDEHRFQIKYGGDLSGLHDVWQDPYGLYVTLFLGINPDKGFFVAVDPTLHNPTRFSVSVEFKDEHADEILSTGWHAWERERRGGAPEAAKKRTERATDEHGEPLFEVLVGGTKQHFLRLIRLEREALGEAPGERQLIAEQLASGKLVSLPAGLVAPVPMVPAADMHALEQEFELSTDELLQLIEERRRLKLAVRGAVAELHLVRALKLVEGVTECERIIDENEPDVRVVFHGKNLQVECKNSSREKNAQGLMKIDLQRSRTSKKDPCSRYYGPADFDLVAACVHACTEKWEFRYARTLDLDPHKTCKGKVSNNVKLSTDRWTEEAERALRAAAGLS